jgi:hypothetical protein
VVVRHQSRDRIPGWSVRAPKRRVSLDHDEVSSDGQQLRDVIKAGDQ